MFACCHRRAPTPAAPVASLSVWLGREPKLHLQQAVGKVANLLNMRKLFARLGRYPKERASDEDETDLTRTIRVVWHVLGHKLYNARTQKLFNHVERRKGVLCYK